jgi:hypothetical protein
MFKNRDERAHEGMWTDFSIFQEGSRQEEGTES